MDLQEQLEIGKNAEDFKRYIEEHPYFNGLVDRVKMELIAQMISLNPSQTQEFSTLMSQIHGIALLPNAISGDIYLGQQAYEKLNGLSEEPKGLL